MIQNVQKGRNHHHHQQQPLSSFVPPSDLQPSYLSLRGEERERERERWKRERQKQRERESNRTFITARWFVTQKQSHQKLGSLPFSQLGIFFHDFLGSPFALSLSLSMIFFLFLSFCFCYSDEIESQGISLSLSWYKITISINRGFFRNRKIWFGSWIHSCVLIILSFITFSPPQS